MLLSGILSTVQSCRHPLSFSTQAGHPNQVAPSKRSYHTIIPGFLSVNDQPIGALGVMGGFMQPQGHLQMVVNLIDYGMNPQTALNAPRWRWFAKNQVLLEQTVRSDIAIALTDRNHQIQLTAEPSAFGRGQMILKSGKVLIAGSEPRADGCAIAF